MAPSLNSAYVIWHRSFSIASLPDAKGRAQLTVANSTQLPSKTQTRSPLLTPTLLKPRARELLLISSSLYVYCVCWCIEMTLITISFCRCQLSLAEDGILTQVCLHIDEQYWQSSHQQSALIMVAIEAVSIAFSQWHDPY